MRYYCRRLKRSVDGFFQSIISRHLANKWLRIRLERVPGILDLRYAFFVLPVIQLGFWRLQSTACNDMICVANDPMKDYVGRTVCVSRQYVDKIK